MFDGLFTALITPFHEDGTLDLKGLIQLVHEQLRAKVDGLVLFGSTGEASTLFSHEMDAIGKAVLREVDGTIPVIFGCTHCNTAVSVQNAKEAEALGADGILIAPPYYNKPNQEGIRQHYVAVASAVKLPILLYNNPFRTSVDIHFETLRQLASLPNVVGMKDCSIKLGYMIEVLTLPNFSLFAGDDLCLLPALSMGCKGLISTLGNLLPQPLVEIYTLCKGNDFQQALAIFQTLFPFFSALSLDTNPIVIKRLMQLQQKPSGPPRLPLTAVSPQTDTLLKRLIYAKKPAFC